MSETLGAMILDVSQEWQSRDGHSQYDSEEQ